MGRKRGNRGGCRCVLLSRPDSRVHPFPICAEPPAQAQPRARLHRLRIGRRGEREAEPQRRLCRQSFRHRSPRWKPSSHAGAAPRARSRPIVIPEQVASRKSFLRSLLHLPPASLRAGRAASRPRRRHARRRSSPTRRRSKRGPWRQRMRLLLHQRRRQLRQRVLPRRRAGRRTIKPAALPNISSSPSGRSAATDAGAASGCSGSRHTESRRLCTSALRARSPMRPSHCSCPFSRT